MAGVSDLWYVYYKLQSTQLIFLPQLYSQLIIGTDHLGVIMRCVLLPILFINQCFRQKGAMSDKSSSYNC